VRGVAADVEVGFLLKELVDELGVLLEAVLDVDLFGAVAGEGGDELEIVAEGFLVLLRCVSGGSKGGGLWDRTYCPLLLVEVVLLLGSASEEEDRLSDGGSGGSLRSTLLDEGAEGCDSGSRTDHNDWSGLGSPCCFCLSARR
jgi:hypothetical protein